MKNHTKILLLTTLATRPKVITLYLIINKIDPNLEKNNGNKYLTLLTTNESKDTLKRMKNYGTKPDILLDQ